MKFTLNNWSPIKRWWNPVLVFTGISIMGFDPNSGGKALHHPPHPQLDVQHQKAACQCQEVSCYLKPRSAELPSMCSKSSFCILQLCKLRSRGGPCLISNSGRLCWPFKKHWEQVPCGVPDTLQIERFLSVCGRVSGKLVQPEPACRLAQGLTQPSPQEPQEAGFRLHLTSPVSIARLFPYCLICGVKVCLQPYGTLLTDISI